MLITLYDFLVFVHILLFVFWLGADMGVAVLGHHFRKRSYSMSERLTILKLLGIIDMFPRSAWALMVPLSLSLLTVGEYWTLTTEVVLLIWLLGFGWLLLVWQIHLKPKNPSISKLKNRICFKTFVSFLLYSSGSYFIVLEWSAFGILAGYKITSFWLHILVSDNDRFTFSWPESGTC